VQDIALKYFVKFHIELGGHATSDFEITIYSGKIVKFIPWNLRLHLKIHSISIYTISIQWKLHASMKIGFPYYFNFN
jgi:hypothetical protein